MFYCRSAELQGGSVGTKSCEINKSFVDWISTSVIMFIMHLENHNILLVAAVH